MKFNFWLALVWIILITVASCARRGTPTGGPKDTIPPKLVRMYPELETVNFDDEEIELEFDEYVEARDLKRELIITPPIEDYSFYISRRTLHLEIEEELRDSTTYTFNFREAVKDASEKNPAQDLVVAFSTGPTIDSFQLEGNIRQLLTQQPVEDAVVSLYDVNDTLDVFTGAPMYLAKTDEEGNYTIRYIREGLYNVYAFVDENSNLTVDSNNEPYGFKTDSIYLGSDVNRTLITDSTGQAQSAVQATKSVDLLIQRQDIRPIQLQSARPNGKYYEIKFNKSLDDYTIRINDELSNRTLRFLEDSVQSNLADTSVTLFSNFQEQNKVIRIYNTLRQDSLGIQISATDSAQQVLPDTVLYIKYPETRRSIADFTSQFTTDGNEFTDTIQGTFTFSKPVARISTDSILLSYDTLFYVPIDFGQTLNWSNNFDRAELYVPISQSQIVDSVIYYSKLNDSLDIQYRIRLQERYLDSLQSDVTIEKSTEWLREFIRQKGTPSDNKILDSLNRIESEDAKNRFLSSYTDTVQINREFPLRTYLREDIISSLQSFNFYASPGSFMSVENDSSEQVIQKFSFKQAEDYGAIRGSVITEYSNYIIQLLDQQYKVIREVKNSSDFAFNMVSPGKYRIRVLIDENNNGEWEAGSILNQQEPESVYFYTEEELIDLRANWERSDLTITIGELSTLSSE
ncbi:MAG: Ig-like domain-containing domain [Cyclobacteriaceae bacterium]